MAAELRHLGFYLAVTVYTLTMLSITMIAHLEFLSSFVLFLVVGIVILVGYTSVFGFKQGQPARYMPLVMSLFFICLAAFLLVSQLLGSPHGNEHYSTLGLTLKSAGLLGSVIKFSRDLRLLVRGSSAPRPPRRSPLLRRGR